MRLYGAVDWMNAFMWVELYAVCVEGSPVSLPLQGRQPPQPQVFLVCVPRGWRKGLCALFGDAMEGLSVVAEEHSTTGIGSD